MIKTPVILITYNRPSFTKKMVNFLNSYDNLNLYVFSDGGKNLNDKKMVENSRKELSKIKHKFKKKYQEKNLGCQRGVETAISWIFEKNDQAIILEDDLVVDKSFFKYAEILLEKFENDNRIMMISANNYNDKINLPYSYFFSKQSSGWGFATWKRAWKQYYETKSLLNTRHLDKSVLNSNKDVQNNFPFFKNSCERKVDSWGYIWRFSMYVNNGLCIYPSVNLVVNKGFGKEATHTKQVTDHFYLKKKTMKFPLKHPPFIFPNEKYDTYIKKSHSFPSMLFQILKNKFLLPIKKG